MKKGLKNVLIVTVSTTWLYRIINAANGIIAMPIVIVGLGKTEYGIWVAICQTANFLVLSDFGIGNAIGRLVARSRGLDDKGSLSEIYSTAMFLLIASALVAALVAVSLSPWIGRLLKLNETYSGLATKVFLIVALSQVVQLPMKISMGILTGHQFYGPHAVGKIITALMHLGGVLLLFVLHKVNIIALAAVDTGAAIFGQLILLMVAWRLTRPWNLSFARCTKKTTSAIFSIGSSALVTTLSNITYRAGIGILLARMVSVGAVGVYGVALTIVENIMPLISSLSTPFSTIASELQAQGQLEKLRRSANTVACIAFSVGFGTVILLDFYSIPLLGLLLHKSNWTISDYLHARNALVIMSGGLAFGLPQIISRSILQGTGKHWYASNSLMISSFSSIGISFLLFKAGLGITAASIGWALVWLLQGVVFLPRMICRFLEQSIGAMVVKCYIPGIMVGSITFLVALLLKYLIPGQDIVPLFFKILCTGMALIGSVIIFCGFKEKVKSFFGSRINKGNIS